MSIYRFKVEVVAHGATVQDALDMVENELTYVCGLDNQLQACIFPATGYLENQEGDGAVPSRFMIEGSKFSEAQHFVGLNYEVGSFNYVLTESESSEEPQIESCGDGLFEFLINEAGDASDMNEFMLMIDVAIKQLQDLKEKACISA